MTTLKQPTIVFPVVSVTSHNRPGKGETNRAYTQNDSRGITGRSLMYLIIPKHTARPDSTKPFCRVGSGDMNWALRGSQRFPSRTYYLLLLVQTENWAGTQVHKKASSGKRGTRVQGNQEGSGTFGMHPLLPGLRGFVYLVRTRDAGRRDKLMCHDGYQCNVMM